ncbi:MAG: hypothetical protein JMN27_13680 [gamma proteobacterium endosymbiont of Lamellibrachia anaximandri]|nr:hypothetical protein [gamma proteobacterium endosymbiont of Lamellibrachia anaximandri]MBL3534866.1 hypothetical protein [gamma proteobacterium endosymbiont of Lamellibrachia anaximandri]MBL3600263.1 hypothetical protein [gamma proteobacterium endosymbiont of Lamellibrachia anaximandri]
MLQAIRHWHGSDYRLVGLLSLTLVMIALFLLGQQETGMSGSSWRRIDMEIFQERLDSGKLSTHEAEWFHAAKPAEMQLRKPWRTP